MDEKIANAKTKTEQAELMGIELPEDDYWGEVSSKVCGMVGGAKGGNFTKEAVESFEKKLVK